MATAFTTKSQHLRRFRKIAGRYHLGMGMGMTHRPRAAPPAQELDLATVMRALGDPVRLEIVRLIADGRLHGGGEVAAHVGLPPSTCSYHLKQLLVAGINEVHAMGAARYPVLRRDALERQFPGLLNLVLAGQPAPARSSPQRASA